VVEVLVIKVIIADDHPPLRVGIRQTLEQARDIRVLAEASDGPELSAMLSRHPSTEVLLLDIEMPGFKVYDAVRQMGTQYPHLKVLIVTAYDERRRILRLIELGVKGFMLKDEPLNMYAHAIREIADGRTYFSARVAHVALTENGRGAIVFSHREFEVLTLAADGLSSTAIGMQLGISPKTVDTHAERACRKLGAKNRTTAVLRAIELGLISVGVGEDGNNSR
jgi:DNA-binding NarL/FixJ family response regulator